MRKILLVSEENPPFKEWTRALRQKGYWTEIFPEIREAAERVLFDLPDMLILQESLSPHLARDLVFALKEDLSLSSLPILLVLKSERISEIEWEDYFIDDFLTENSPKEEVLSRVQLAFIRSQRLADNNPLTGLPGNTSILRKIEEVLESPGRWAVAYVDLDHFKPYNDTYGFSRGDEVIRMVARLLVNTVEAHAGPKGFVGHIGGDDFVFIVPLEVAEEVAREIIQNFDELILNFVNEEDRRRGCLITTDRQGVLCRLPWPSVSIAIVPVWPGRFHHYGEVAAVAAQIKHYLKKMPGSAFLIDRRKEKKKRAPGKKERRQGSQGQKGPEGEGGSS
ncbi:GGDEF domain-containing protein [Thermosulfurimonas marina]|uniref:diguanylate cyclase n=1 Tax=Thermosulfurimonas marina TaxID=2047767 RepID=A0A6H1WRU0_9BACT|nr:GGDEF domain-containing protein [Thermosulfurimonas marina]QJA05856.1 GGDEF domain-containing protein [Thermosulfurimonas marina]